MVLLFSVAELFVWLVFFMVLFWLFGKIAQGGNSKTKSSRSIGRHLVMMEELVSIPAPSRKMLRR